MPHFIAQAGARARLFGCLVSAAALALTLSGCANKSSSTSSSGGGAASDAIVVGEYGSMTGAQATFGVATDNGIQLAVSQINAAGGIDGHKVQIGSTGKPEDDQGQPDAALTAVKKLITQDKAVAILGEVASKNSIAAAPFCNDNKVPMISPSSTNPKVTQTGPYIFRVCFIDPFQGTVAAKFATGTLHAKTAAVLYDKTSDYSNGLQDFFQKAFTAQGGKIVSVSTYQAGDPDFRSALTTIRATNPDLLYVPGYYNDVGTIARQAREVGITAPLDGRRRLGVAGSASRARAGRAALWRAVISPITARLDVKDPVVKKFVDCVPSRQQRPKSPDALTGAGLRCGGGAVRGHESCRQARRRRLQFR